MNDDAMVFAMANPNPEVTPEEAAPYARIIATGRSDYPNQINNVLCFPGVFRGALDVRARTITEEMKMAAARGIAEIVADDELREDYIIPSVFNRDVAAAVADAVAAQAKEQGAATAAGDEVGYAPGDTSDFRARRRLGHVPRHGDPLGERAPRPAIDAAERERGVAPRHGLDEPEHVLDQREREVVPGVAQPAADDLLGDPDAEDHDHGGRRVARERADDDAEHARQHGGDGDVPQPSAARRRPRSSV